MTKYTNEKKELALSQMSAQHNKPVADTGVPEAIRIVVLPQAARSAGAAASRPRQRWRTEVHTAFSSEQNRTGATEHATEKKRIRELENDLRRKEKTLAETAVLLMLSRNYEALLTDGEGA